MFNLKNRVTMIVAVALALAAPAAFAGGGGGTSYDGIVSAVDWSDVVTGITAIAALIAAVLVVKRGVKMLLSMIGR